VKGGDRKLAMFSISFEFGLLIKVEAVLVRTRKPISERAGVLHGSIDLHSTCDV